MTDSFLVPCWHGECFLQKLINTFLSFVISTDIAPVCEGAVQHIASKRFGIGGFDLTKLLAQELQRSNPLANIDISEVEKLKEQYACSAEDQTAFERTQNSCHKETHTLPDGQVRCCLDNYLRTMYTSMFLYSCFNLIIYMEHHLWAFHVFNFCWCGICGLFYF